MAKLTEDEIFYKKNREWLIAGLSGGAGLAATIGGFLAFPPAGLGMLALNAIAFAIAKKYAYFKCGAEEVALTLGFFGNKPPKKSGAHLKNPFFDDIERVSIKEKTVNVPKPSQIVPIDKKIATVDGRQSMIPYGDIIFDEISYAYRVDIGSTEDVIEYRKTNFSLIEENIKDLIQQSMRLYIYNMNLDLFDLLLDGSRLIKYVQEMVRCFINDRDFEKSALYFLNSNEQDRNGVYNPQYNLSLLYGGDNLPVFTKSAGERVKTIPMDWDDQGNVTAFQSAPIARRYPIKLESFIINVIKTSDDLRRRIEGAAQQHFIRNEEEKKIEVAKVIAQQELQQLEVFAQQVGGLAPLTQEQRANLTPQQHAQRAQIMQNMFRLQETVGGYRDWMKNNNLSTIFGNPDDVFRMAGRFLGYDLGNLPQPQQPTH